ncbi:hypothetical protein KCU67_g6124, partial [Aureobasidium melanogenum]
MFLCAVTEDWEVAEEYRTKANFVWRMMRLHYHKRARDKDMETKLAEIRMGLNQLKWLQLKAKPDSWYDEYDPYAEEEEEEEEEQVEADEEEEEVDEEYELDDADLQRAKLQHAEALSADNIVNNNADDIHSSKQVLLDARETTLKLLSQPSKLGRDAPH